MIRRRLTGREDPKPSAAADATPAELSEFAALTPDFQMWVYLRRLAAAYPRSLELVEIGRSEGGLPVFAARLGLRHDDATARVLIFAQQHGDEPAGKEASLLLIRDLAAGRSGLPLDRLQVWIVPQVNPDGAAVAARRNGRGQDLNRGHHVLAARELRALYGLFHRVLPHLTVDLHEFNVEREEWAAPDTTCGYDVMAEGPTNLNVGPTLRALGLSGLDAVGRTLEGRGFAFRRYLVGDPSPGTPNKPPRYSTLRACDGRNTPALFGALSFISEAMRHGDLTACLEQRVGTCYAAAVAFLDFAAAHRDEIVRCVQDERERLARGPGASVVVRGRYRAAAQRPPLRYAYRRAGTGELGEYTLREARTLAEAVARRTLPDAYWLDFRSDDPALSEVLGILEGHDVEIHRVERPRRALVASDLLAGPRVGSPAPARPGPRHPTTRREMLIPTGALLVPTEQLGSRLVALLLELGSIDRAPALDGWRPTSDDAYPIRRVIEAATPG